MNYSIYKEISRRFSWHLADQIASQGDEADKIASAILRIPPRTIVPYSKTPERVKGNTK